MSVLLCATARRAAMIIGVTVAVAGGGDSVRATTPMKFGVDSEALELAASRGMTVSYATFWVGTWTQRYGWGYAEEQLRAAAARNVTPVVHWWYWGDDISPQCVERGCQDRYHSLFKDRAAWNRMSQELADLIARTLGTREAIVIIESEFNKGGIETYEPFDGYLADQIATFKRSGNIKTVVGFGNWGRSNWGRFDRAVQASDYLGVQLLRSSVREAATYLDAIDALVDGAAYLQRTFGKPSLITDLALSSYPASSYETYQEVVAEELFQRIGELKDAGVHGVLYRMLVDDPNFDTSNYHGVAERHWGLLRADRTAKPAFAQFVAGIRRESAPGNQTPSSPTPPPAPAPPTPPAPTPAPPTPAPPAPAPSPAPAPAPAPAPPAPAPAPPAPAPPAPPPAPTPDARAARNLRVTALGRTLRLDWDAPIDSSGISGYMLEAGSVPGSADLAVVPAYALSFSADSVPDGRYYVRVKSVSGGTLNAASNEVIAVVGAATCESAPAAPVLSASAAGSLVTLRWTPPSDQTPSSYVLDVGSAAGQSNLIRATVPGGATSLIAQAPGGTYFLRLAAVNACGTSAPSNEVVLAVR